MKKLTKPQKAVLALALVPMVAVGVAGGIGTYSNISGAYGKGTAIGALAAGEGATAVLALLLLGLTLLGQSSPRIIRIGLWALPATAAVMGATAATKGTGQAIVYAATPMAITAAAEGLAFLVRRIVVHQEGRDAEAEARATAVIRDLAYHQARVSAPPNDPYAPDAKARKKSAKKAWKLAKRLGTGDATLGADLLDVQHTRLTDGADVALSRLFSPGTTVPALPAASAPELPAVREASTSDATTSRHHDVTVRPDANGYPDDTTGDQGENAETVRPALHAVRDDNVKKPSIAQDVRAMVRDGVKDVQHVLDAVATRHHRDAADPKLKSTVGRYFRQAKADDPEPESAVRDGLYL